MEDKNLFKNLTSEEEADFRKWAADNYTVGTTIQSTWHPVVQQACRKMNLSAREPKVRVIVTKMDGTVLNDYEVTPAMTMGQFPSVPCAATDIELSNELEEKIRNSFDILDDLYWEAMKELEAELEAEREPKNES
tara:strand:+ start:891 stop:1295 length:405 start_codon:yes stop_codon:yes gene_type:complete